MINTSFLHKLAQKITVDYANNFADITIVLPNKRAKVFLIEELKKELNHTAFSPDITSVEEFVQQIAEIRSVDTIELLFEFYTVYLSITQKEKQEPFETFANWATTLLQDFNEIDRYLLPPNEILKYLENIKEIEHWAVDVDKRTPLIDNYLAFWKLLPFYYDSLYNYLRDKKIGYQGLIYREAVSKLAAFSNVLGNKIIVFAGFNALNQAEEKIIQHLLSIGKAKIYWDIDQTFLNDPFHDAGLFIRRFKQTWDYYKTNPFEWIANDYQQEKNIEIIGTAKSVGQAKIVGKIIENQIALQGSNDLKNTVIVLGEESLLTPILYSLPDTIPALNITMGYAAKNNPAQILISKLFKAHTHALSRNASSYVFYYKDVLDILTHPLIEPFVDAKELVDQINQNNFTFLTHKRLLELNKRPSPLFVLLFQKWESTSLNVLETLSQILLTIKANLNYNNEEEKITNAFIYAVFKVINKLISYYTENTSIDNINTLQAIYKQVAEVAEVSFEGEPLNGLQIMGVLESRVLDFDTVIITSVNEGKFPAGKSTNSFIPYDVKKERGLPTYKEKDAIYTYHFYHLLQRAKTVYLLYNTESEGIDGGEKSRFITQLEVEKQEKHTYTQAIFNAEVPNIAHQPIVVLKSEKVMLRLKEIAEKGFSPSSLTSYIRNPIVFYFQKILRISQTEEVEEDIAVNTLGTIIHGALEEMYQPFIHCELSETHITQCILSVNDVVARQFKKVYKEGEIKKGKNLLAFEVAKRNVLNFLNLELETIKNGDRVKIVALEQRFERILTHSKLPYPIKIGGSVDRIEIRNEKIRIIDYKTGRVDKSNLQLKQWNGLIDDIKNDKIIQVLAYALLYEPHSEGKEIEAGIISFKNLKSGFMPFTFKQDNEINPNVTKEVLNEYLEQIVVLLAQILDTTQPFEEKLD